MPEGFDGNMPGGISCSDESFDSDEQKTTDSNFNRPFMDRFPAMNDDSEKNTMSLILLGISASVLRACSVSQRVRIFEHNFVEDKEKIRRHTDVWQGFLTHDSAKFAEKTCAGRY